MLGVLIMKTIMLMGIIILLVGIIGFEISY
ncbi:unknown [Mycoplasma sp. CAG:776]|nr:unknown [Mycoplasma sp. CAG:776]